MKVEIRCKLKVQVGLDEMVFVDGMITRIIPSDNDKFKYMVRADDQLYYCQASELWINLGDYCKYT